MANFAFKTVNNDSAIFLRMNIDFEVNLTFMSSAVMIALKRSPKELMPEI